MTQQAMIQFTPEVLITPPPPAPPPPPPPPEIETCCEPGRVTRAYVSGYQRARVHLSRLVRGDKRCLVANFNGAMAPSRTIASAVWRCMQPYQTYMADARLSTDLREATVNIDAQAQGMSVIKCVATLDNGEQITQMFNIAIKGTPWFMGETFPSTGPYSLTATAPVSA